MPITCSDLLSLASQIENQAMGIAADVNSLQSELNQVQTDLADIKNSLSSGGVGGGESCPDLCNNVEYIKSKVDFVSDSINDLRVDSNAHENLLQGIWDSLTDGTSGLGAIALGMTAVKGGVDWLKVYADQARLANNELANMVGRFLNLFGSLLSIPALIKSFEIGEQIKELMGEIKASQYAIEGKIVSEGERTRSGVYARIDSSQSAITVEVRSSAGDLKSELRNNSMIARETNARLGDISNTSKDIKIGVDSANSGIKTNGSAIASTSQLVKSLEGGISTIGQSVNGLTGKLDGVSGKIDILGGKVDGITPSINALGSGINARLDGISNQIAGIRIPVQQSTQAVQQAAATTQQNTQKLTSYQQALQQQKATIELVPNQIKQFQEQQKQILSQFPSQIQQSQNAVVTEIKRNPDRTATEVANELKPILLSNPALNTALVTGGVLAGITPIINASSQRLLTEIPRAVDSNFCSPTSCSTSAVKTLGNNLGSKLDAFNTVGNLAQMGLLTRIDNKLGPQLANGGISGFVQRFARSLHLDKVLNVLTTVTVLHNAAMLSGNLAQTLGDVTSTAINALIIRDENAEQIDVNEILGKQFDQWAAQLLGQEAWTGVKTTWNKANRIVSTASNVVWSIRSIGDSIREISEWTAENTGKIGNALKRFRVVGENAYGWMPEQVNGGTASQRRLQRMRDNLEPLDDAASSLQGVLGEVQNITSEVNELRENKQAFDQAIQTATPKARPENQPVKAAADAADAASSSPETTLADRNKAEG